MAQIKQQDNVWRFSGDMVLANVSELLSDADKLSYAKNMELDFTFVKEVDTSAISFIFEVQRRLNKTISNQETVEAENQPAIKLIAVPENLKKLMQLYGVDGFLLA